MRLIPTVAVAALAAAAFVPQAYAQAPQRSADMRCVVVAAQVAAMSDEPAMKTAMMSTAMYYLGKLKGREPGLDLKTLAEAEFTRMTPDTAKTEAGRCSAEMAAFNQEVTAISQALKAKAGAN
jgi:hypothetical protein